MDYEGTRDNASEVPMGEVALGRPGFDLTAAASASAGGMVLIPDASNTVVLPDGASLDDITVRGRDLVIQLDDGRIFIIPDGAVFVPQIVAQGVTVPPLNLAALLIGQEPEPAAGPVRSSGGNFAVPVDPLQDAYDLGDLLPYTELSFPQPEGREVFPRINRTPDVEIEDGSPPSKNAVDEVNEAGLLGTRTGNVNPESLGSAAGNNSHITDGRILIESPDGIASVTINGIAITGVAGQVIDTPRGTLVLGALANGQIPYVYTLKDNTTGDGTSDVFTVVVTDPDGDSSTASLTINIIDDEPTARNDIDDVPAQNYQPQGGNVITGEGTTTGATGADTIGADGPTVAAGAVTGVHPGTGNTAFTAPGTQIDGQFGTLTLNADGSYTYTRNLNTPGGESDVFTYQIKDGDGDINTATLTIRIADAPTTITFVPEIGEGTEVLESHLPPRNAESEGSQFDGDADVTTGTITFVSPDGVSSVSIGGTAITAGSLPQTVASDATGTLVINGYTYDPVTGQGSITYTYTLLDNTLNTNGSTVSFPITVVDLDMDSATDTLDIRIIDDAPTARDDSGSQTAEDAPITVNVLLNDTKGADGVNIATSVTVVAGSLTGEGTLVYNNDGTFTYTPTPGEEGKVTFQYTITDGDGDPSTALVTITLLPDSVPSVEVIGENVVYEAGLPARGAEPEGSDEPASSETNSGTLAIETGNDSVKALFIGGVNVTAGGTVTGDHGTLTVTLDAGIYSYSYTLTDNTSGDATTDSFTVEVTDSDDDVASTNLVIDIMDDQPTAVDDTDTVPGGTLGPATGNVITDNAAGDAGDLDDGKDTPGADGVALSAITSDNEPGNTATYDELTKTFTIQGEYGTLTIEGDGDYSYTRNEGTPGSVEDVFTYTVTDGDDDPTSAQLAIFIDDNAPVTGENNTALLDDDALGGIVGGAGDRDPDTLNLSGNLAGSGGDGVLTWSFLTSGNPGGFTYVAAGDDLQVWQGGIKVLTITLDPANGAYTVTQNAPIDHAVAGTEDNQLFTINYQVEDTDGDKAFGVLNVDVDDDSPTVDVSITAVAEPVLTTLDAGTDGSPSEQNSASSAAAFGGVFALTSATGADGGATPSLTYALGVTASVSGLESHDAPIYLYKIGAAVVGSTSSTQAGVNAGNTVFDVTVSASGVVTLTQYQQVDHALEGTTTAPFDDQFVALADGLVTLTASATITDGDLDTASDSATVSIGANLRFADDGPDITAALVGGSTIRVDETDGVVAAGGEIDPLGGNLGSVTLSAASLFTVSQPGTSADAPTVLSYGFKITEGASSGLLRSSDNAVIVLHDAGGGVIEGRVGTTAGALAFTVSIDPASGAVTLTQYIAVEHGNTASHDEDSSGLTSGALLIEIKATDFDGDTDTATVDLGSVIRFEDDGPTLDVSRTTAPEPVLATQDAETINAATDTATSSGAFGGVFQLASTPGSDGANTPSLSYALSLAVAAGTNSGLTIGGAAIKLYNVGGVIVGSTAASAPASATDASVVFSMAVDGSGVVTLSQLQQIDHPIGSDPSPTITPFADHQVFLANGLVNLTASATITDNDGDTVTDSETIDLGGNIRFDDHGPSAASDADSVTEDGPSVADGNVFTGSGGSDANGTDGVADSIGADGPATGGAVTAISGGTVGTPFATTYGTLELKADGSYTYTLDNTKLAVQQLDTGETRQEVFTYTITDRDGDTATATLTITINGANDAPIVGTASVAVSDEGLNNGITDNAGNPTDTTNNALTTGQITITDVDGEAQTVTLGLPTGALSYNNAAITWTGMGTDQLIGSVGATQVVIVTIADDGLFSVELLQPIDHPDGLAENVAAITIPVTVSDGTASVPTTISVSFEDDSPIAVAGSTSGSVDEDGGLAGGIAGGTGDLPAATTVVTGSVTSLFQSGADVPLSYALSTAGQTLPTLASGGIALTYALTTTATGTLLTASAGANPVFTLALNAATGGWTFTLIRPLDHTNGGDENDLVLQFGSLITATDSDNDTVRATGTLTVTVDDDTPTASANVTQPTLTVDETTLASNATISFASVFTTAFGADGAAAVNATTYTLGISASGAASGLTDTLTGQAVLLYMNGTTVEGRTAIGNQVVFVLTVDAGGSVTLDQQRAVVHSPNLGPNDTTSLLADTLVTLTATVTDRDLDSQSATANIGQNLVFTDDAPAITAATTPLAIANSGAVAGTGQFVVNPGTDGAPSNNDLIKTATFAATVNGQAVSSPTITAGSETATAANYTFSFTYTTGANTTATANGTLVFDKVAGTYTVDLDNPIQGFSINQTSAGTAFQGYELNTATPDNTQPAVAVTTITPNLFIQYTGIDGTATSGSTAPNAWTQGENFSATASWVSVSNLANGVAGDTIGGNEILNFNLYSSNPTGNVGTPTASAESMFLKFDGIGGNEDFIVILKLFDASTNTFTTKALMVQNGDIQKGPGTGPGIFSGITLDNNDGLVVFEKNDYNAVGENWVIVGAQIVVDPGVITGTAIDFNNAIGVASTGTLSFETDVNNGAPMKISSIGFVTNTTTSQSAQLTFNVTVQDGDLDTASQQLVVNIGGTPPIALDLDGDGVEYLGLNAGVTYDYAGDGNAEATAWVGGDDGLLARDANGSGTVDSASEFVFGHDGLTDLQAVAADYDINGDGVLDAQDAAFAEFGVWQDANSNGTTDAGEFQTLTDLGITSINLVSDGNLQSAAGGDVTVFGETTYTKADGTTGIVADVAFATEEQRQASTSIQLVTASTAATGLLAAIATEHAAATADDGIAKAASKTADLADGGAPAALPESTSDTAQNAATPALDIAQAAPTNSAHSADRAITDTVGLVRLEEHGSELSTDSSKSNLFGDASSAMDALLTPGAFADSGGLAQTSHPAIAAALADSAGAEAVDAIVDHFAGAHEALPEQLGLGEATGFESLLQLGVSGGGADLAGAQFAMMQMIDLDEQANAMA